MVSDDIYELCSPILDNDSLAEEDKTDQIEDVISKEHKLTGKALENAVLGVLWRRKGSDTGSPVAIRSTVIRRPSPAPWQMNRSSTPLASSPRSTSASFLGPSSLGPGALARARSSNASPSPKPSPRLALATPQIPHSPSLSAYQFSEPSPSLEYHGDLGSDNVDWLVNDDASSSTSYGDTNAPNSEFLQPANVDMTPYDILRSILRDGRSDEELNNLLESNGYDLSQTIASLVDNQAAESLPRPKMTETKSYLVGKSMSPTSRPVTPAGQAKSPIVCRYFLASGHCARADCRFSHDLTSHVCKYWMAGNCLAGDACMFSHDPSLLVSQITVSPSNDLRKVPSDLQLQDMNSFPSLQRSISEVSQTDTSLMGSPQSTASFSLAQSAMNPFANFVPNNLRAPQESRPTSRQTSRTMTPSALSFQDDEFPSLGNMKTGRRQAGKRGERQVSQIPSTPMSAAEIVRMSPGPLSPMSTTPARKTRSTRSMGNDLSIPPPEHIPWLETGQEVNRAYMKARAEALRRGSLRNRFLQGAAQAWSRGDTKQAKALSLRGQNENTLMKEAHREAAKVLYDDRNRNAASGKELYIDLHGLHPEEAISYLADCLLENKGSSRPLYAICGTGHHSKNGKDKVGKSVRAYLTEWRYSFREFSVPGDRNNLGGIIGVDPSSFDHDIARKSKAGSEADSGVGLNALAGEDTKVRVVAAGHVGPL